MIPSFPGNYVSKFLPLPPWDGLPLPRGLNLRWKNMVDTLGSYAASIRKIVLPTKDPPIMPDSVYLAYKSISMAAVHAGDDKLDEWEKKIRKWAQVNDGFAKMEVVYLDFSPPPVFWDYKCMKCRFYMDPGRCAVVGGQISTEGWCTIWIPPVKYKRLSYPMEFLKADW